MRNLQTENEYQDYYYGSEIRDKAIILFTLTLLKKEEEALPLLKDICERLNSTSWYSTQSMAWGLFSYMKWSEMVPTKTESSKIKVNLNGEKSEQTVLARQLLTKDLKMKSVNNTLIVENISENPLYLTLIRKGIPLVSDMLRQEKGLSMRIDYLDMNLKTLDQKNLIQGSDFMMVAKVTNTTFRKVDNIAFNQMVPSGWEIQNTRLFDANYGIKESPFDYRDIRDDRVNTYFSLNGGETKTFTLILNAAYKGEFYQPAIWCEAMYTPDCYSRFPGTTVNVSGAN
jgi:uncharacterized protein YfaS (alpha-2-macroglobulin family)